MYTISFNYKNPLQSQSFNNLLYKAIPAGVYDGMGLTKVDNTNITIAPGSIIVESANTAELVSVKITSLDTEARGITEIAPYITLSYDWSTSTGNEPVIINKAIGSVLATDIILGKGNFTGSTLVDFDYSESNIYQSTFIGADVKFSDVIADTATIGIVNATTLNVATVGITDLTMVNGTATGSMIVPNATVDTHAMNRITSDNRYVEVVGDVVTGTLGVDGIFTIGDKIITSSNVNLGLNTVLTNIGTGGTGSCVVIGENASVSGNSILDLNSIAIGADSTASGYNSVALGDNSVALGDNSVALGDNSVASGYSSVASGYNSVASGYYSVAIGSGINVTDYSVGIGFNADSNSNCGDHQININNRILYFEFPSTASQNTVYDALAPYISSPNYIGAMGRFGNYNIALLTQTSSTLISARNHGDVRVANFTNGSSTVLGSDLQVAFVPYVNID